MQNTVLKAIRADARSWWYHAQLRKQGAHEEARKREHESVRSTVKHIRETLASGGYMTRGRGGATLHINRFHTVQGLHSGTWEACLLAGIPAVDTRTIPDHLIGQTLNLPIPAAEADAEPAPWGPLSLAPFSVMAPIYKALGATLYNVEAWPKPDLANFRHVSVLEQAEEIGGFFGREIAQEFFQM